MIGSLDHLTRQLIVHTSPTKRSSDFIADLEHKLTVPMAPNPGGRAMKPVVLVEDNGPIHVSKLALAALEARKHWLTVEWLPKYAPELNDIEVVWHDLKAHNLAHYTFTDAADLDRAIHQAVQALNNERLQSVGQLENLCLGVGLLPSPRLTQSSPVGGRENYARCSAARRILIGKDAARGFGRVFPFSRLKPGDTGYTRSCNMGIQGALRRRQPCWRSLLSMIVCSMLT